VYNDDDRHSIHGRVNSTPVLDHLLLFREHHDARCAFLNFAMPSPMPLVASSTTSPFVTCDLPQMLKEAI
jgi:hypothetical protein